MIELVPVDSLGGAPAFVKGDFTCGFITFFIGVLEKLVVGTWALVGLEAELYFGTNGVLFLLYAKSS